MPTLDAGHLPPSALGMLAPAPPDPAGSLTGGTHRDGNPVNMEGRSTEIMRRQSDGSWLDVIDDPYSQA